MSGSSVVVLAPNGRRQTVKCTPNTTILQIIEEVCRKQGFTPEEYNIKHHNKVIDTMTTFRFSGLPNNAQLELSPALKNRTESDITLAVNLEDGSRVTDIFTPNDTLLNILNKVSPESIAPGKNPVVIYTRQEIYGKELENCTLRSLGLTGGRAMIRVLNRQPEMLKKQANVSAPLPSKPVEEKPYQRKFQPLDDTPMQSESEKSPSPPKESSMKNTSDIQDSAEDNQPASVEIKPQKNVKNTTVDVLKLAKEKRKCQEQLQSNEEKRKSLEKDDQKGNRRSGQKPMEIDDEDLETSNIIHQKSIEEEFVFCGARNGMIFSLESANAVPSEELPDDFFELTIDDAKKILRDVKRKRFEMDNQNLKTSRLRELDDNKKQLRQLNKYKKAVIRVQLPDRTVIQGTFKPLETVKDVADFVRSYLRDQNLDFYIYSTPPKSILNPGNNLLELGCVPGALLYFGTKEEQKDNLLKKEYQNVFTTNSVASLAAARIRNENTRHQNQEYLEISDQDMDTSNDVNFGASTSTAYNNGTTNSSTEDSIKQERRVVLDTEKMPKWFKPL